MLCGNAAYEADTCLVCDSKVQRAAVASGAGGPRAGNDQRDPRRGRPARGLELLGSVLPAPENQGGPLPSEQKRKEDLANTGVGAFETTRAIKINNKDKQQRQGQAADPGNVLAE